MTLYDKEYLVKWLGWEEISYGSGAMKMIYSWFYEGKERSLSKWNPDTNHEQFTEVWNNLTRVQQTNVEFLSANSSWGWGNMLLNDLPTVLDNLLTVIKGIK